MANEYDDLPEFNDWIDRVYEEDSGAQSSIVIFEESLKVSEILYHLRPVTYRAAYEDYETDLMNQLKESVVSEYPSPIAYHFYRFEHGYENKIQRLHFLRSTWEALINIIHAGVVSEARYRGISLTKSQVKMGDLLTDSLAKRLQNIQYILSYTNENSIKLHFRELVPEEAIKLMAKLNKTRNAFSHSDSISTEQADKYINECVDDVYKVLNMLYGLRSVTILRYLELEGLQIRYEEFFGHAMTKTIKTIKISEDQLIKSVRLFDSSQILVLCEHDIFSLKPFIHFRSSSGGHETRLCYLKKCRGSGSDRQLCFETLGESFEDNWGRKEFQESINDLRTLFDLKPEKAI